MSESADLMKKLEIDKLTVAQRVELIDEIWKSIDAHTMHVGLPSPAQIAAFEKHMDAVFDDWDSEDEDLFVFPREH